MEPSIIQSSLPPMIMTAEQEDMAKDLAAETQLGWDSGRIPRAKESAMKGNPPRSFKSDLLTGKVSGYMGTAPPIRMRVLFDCGGLRVQGKTVGWKKDAANLVVLDNEINRTTLPKGDVLASKMADFTESSPV